MVPSIGYLAKVHVKFWRPGIILQYFVYLLIIISYNTSLKNIPCTTSKIYVHEFYLEDVKGRVMCYLEELVDLRISRSQPLTNGKLLQ